jgi:nucleotide-binding universal stress UspA family protein
MRVLIAVDGSTECEVSLRGAGRWLGILNADVYMLQVIDGPGSTDEQEVSEQKHMCIAAPNVLAVMKNVRDYLDELVSRYELPADRTRSLVSLSDNAVEEIITIAQTNGVDLIAMCSPDVGVGAPSRPGAAYAAR